MRALRWAFKRRRLILAWLSAISVAYAIVLIVVPWRFCHSEGYVIGSLTVFSLVILELANVWGRDETR